MCFLFFSFLFLRLPLSLFSLLPFCFLLFAPNVILQSKQRKNLFIHLKKKKTSNPEGERVRERAVWILLGSFFFFQNLDLLSSLFFLVVVAAVVVVVIAAAATRPTSSGQTKGA